MTHHLLPQLPRDWIPLLINVLLIRDPAEVVASYVRSRADVVAGDIGLVQQGELYDQLGPATPVIDAADFLHAPEAHLRWLCDHVGVDFTPACCSGRPVRAIRRRLGAALVRRGARLDRFRALPAAAVELRRRRRRRPTQPAGLRAPARRPRRPLSPRRNLDMRMARDAATLSRPAQQVAARLPTRLRLRVGAQHLPLDAGQASALGSRRAEPSHVAFARRRSFGAPAPKHHDHGRGRRRADAQRSRPGRRLPPVAGAGHRGAEDRRRSRRHPPTTPRWRPQQRRPSGPRVRTVVVLDSCTDQTAEIVADFPWVRPVHAGVGRVGAARSIAVRHGLGLTSAPPATTWIVNTDADSRVPRDWLTHQLSLAGIGADLVCGLVDPDPSECGPTRYAAWLAAYRRVDGHPHVHGANLGLRADCYLDCGGFTARRRAHEDVALVRAAEARGWNVVASRGATVRTSGRVEGRVPAGGFAGYLRSCVPTPGPIDAVVGGVGVTATGVRLHGPEASAAPEADRAETGWLDELAARAQGTDGVATAAVELARDLGSRVPPPAGGRTIERWEVLASLAAGDLSVARIAEAHLDALAILAESGAGPVADRAVWGVYAAEGPGMRLEATPGPDGWHLTGRKPWCSAADVNDRALVTAHVDGGRRLFAIDLKSPTVSGGQERWVARGLADVRSTSIVLDHTPGTPVGETAWYLTRPGFAWGGMGVAACWFGGLVGVARRVWSAGLKREPDQVGSHAPGPDRPPRDGRPVGPGRRCRTHRPGPGRRPGRRAARRAGARSRRGRSRSRRRDRRRTRSARPLSRSRRSTPAGSPTSSSTCVSTTPSATRPGSGSCSGTSRTRTSPRGDRGRAARGVLRSAVRREPGPVGLRRSLVRAPEAGHHHGQPAAQAVSPRVRARLLGRAAERAARGPVRPPARGRCQRDRGAVRAGSARGVPGGRGPARSRSRRSGRRASSTSS